MQSEPRSNESERVKVQTTDEWVAEYSQLEPTQPKSDYLLASLGGNLRVYKFVEHRTVHNPGKRGRLILTFEDAESGEYADAFFNVSVCFERGKKKGKPKAVGRGCPFNPPIRPTATFYNFWMDSFGREPTRWSSVHKEMHKLRGLDFKAEVEQRFTGKGEPYFHLSNLLRIKATS